jgi:hypothetical protein
MEPSCARNRSTPSTNVDESMVRGTLNLALGYCANYLRKLAKFEKPLCGWKMICVHHLHLWQLLLPCMCASGEWQQKKARRIATDKQSDEPSAASHCSADNQKRRDSPQRAQSNAEAERQRESRKSLFWAPPLRTSAVDIAPRPDRIRAACEDFDGLWHR